MLEKNKTEGEGKQFVTEATTGNCIAVIHYFIVLHGLCKLVTYGYV